MTQILVPALRGDEFEGEAGIDSSNGGRRLVDILILLAESGFLGRFTASALPVTLKNWQDLGFTALPSAGMIAYDTTDNAPVWWNGTAWMTATGASPGAGAGSAKYLVIGPVAAKGTNNVSAAVQESAINAFPGPFTNPDVPRNLRVVFAAGWQGGDVTVVGTDQFNAPVSETFVAVAGTTVVGLKMFKTVTGASKTTVAGTTDTASIGTGDEIAVPAHLSDANGFLWVGTTPEAVTLDTTHSAFAPTTVPAATTYKLLANVAA